MRQITGKVQPCSLLEINNQVAICWGSVSNVHEANVTLPITYSQIIQPFKCLLSSSNAPAVDNLLLITVTSLSTISFPAFAFNMCYLCIGY